MKALILVAHPDPESLTHAIANAIAGGLLETNGHTVERADLSAEGFDPRFSQHDVDAYHGVGEIPSDVVQEQTRVDRSDALVLVFPIYWWGMPALLKGWIDRVFVNGWAFEIAGDTERGKLGRLTVFLVGIGGSGPGTYSRRGYTDAMRTAIERGVFGYCGANMGGFHFLLDSESGDQSANLEKARDLGRSIGRVSPIAEEYHS